MASTSAIRAENNTLFAIDMELEAHFEAATNEEEQTGVISEEAKQSCLDLFAELGKKVDRIARYLRATEFKARAAKEEAARLTARQKTAENLDPKICGAGYPASDRTAPWRIGHRQRLRPCTGHSRNFLR